MKLTTFTKVVEIVAETKKSSDGLLVSIRDRSTTAEIQISGALYDATAVLDRDELLAWARAIVKQLEAGGKE